MGGHSGRFVVEEDTYDFLRDAAVDQSAGEGVPPLVGRQADGPAVLVANVAGRQPAAEHLPVAGVGHPQSSRGVRVRSGEQDSGALGPAFENAVLVIADGLFELLVDRDGRFALHLGVEIPQVGGALADPYGG
jgi:hypothetical protein